MDTLLLIARLLLAGVFGLAGITKAGDPNGSRQALRDFGVPARWAGLLSRGLPGFEILIALALLPLASAWWGAVTALALLLLFTAAIVISLARGQAPDCRCFGQLHARPVNRMTIIRNLLLAAVAGLIVVQRQPGLSAFAWLADWRTAEVTNLILAGCGVGLLLVAVSLLRRMLKQQATLLDQLGVLKAALEDDLGPLPVMHKTAAPLTEGLPIGARAPQFRLGTIGGDNIALADLLKPGRPLVLLFVGPNCTGCGLLLPMVRTWQREFAERLTIAVISHGTRQENQIKLAKYELDRILLDEKLVVADEYQSHWTPAAVMINPDGTIASLNVYGDNAIREWLRNLLAATAPAPDADDGLGWQQANGRIPQVALRYAAQGIGEPPPEFALRDLSDRVVKTADLVGRPTLLFFWHPLCQFCQAMFADLRRWEEEAAIGAPRLILIACGQMEDIKKVNHAFKSTTLLDPAFEIGPLFGTKTTPAAILIDEQGRIASGLAMDEQNVRALMGLQRSSLQAAAQA